MFFPVIRFGFHVMALACQNALVQPARCLPESAVNGHAALGEKRIDHSRLAHRQQTQPVDDARFDLTRRLAREGYRQNLL